VTTQLQLINIIIIIIKYSGKNFCHGFLLTAKGDGRIYLKF